jgi:hypothetical protein
MNHQSYGSLCIVCCSYNNAHLCPSKTVNKQWGVERHALYGSLWKLRAGEKGSNALGRERGEVSDMEEKDKTGEQMRRQGVCSLVVGAEVMPPLTHAVALVYDDPRQLATRIEVRHDVHQLATSRHLHPACHSPHVATRCTLWGSSTCISVTAPPKTP